MAAIALLLYLIILLFLMVAGFFIAFHIFQYSFRKEEAVTTLLVFLPIFSILLISNFLLFMSLKLETLISFFN